METLKKLLVFLVFVVIAAIFLKQQMFAYKVKSWSVEYAKVQSSYLIDRYDGDDEEYEYALSIGYAFQLNDRVYTGQDDSYYSNYRDEVAQMQATEFRNGDYIEIYYDPEFPVDNLIFKPYSFF
jgi:hypothetical protein